MPISVVQYSSVNTKVRSLYGKLLAKHDYEELLGKRTVQDIAAYLKKNTGYQILLSEIDENRVHRGELEKLFKTSLYSDFLKLFHFLRGRPHEFLRAFFLRYEVEDLKMLFRAVHTGRENEAVVNSLIFLKKFSKLDFEKLTASKTIPALIFALKGSEYFKPLSPFISVAEQPKLFDIEMALDLHFFLTLLKLKDRLLTGTDRESITQTFGTEIDLLNIFMIYRCKKLFKIPPELVFKYVIPYWYRLSREQLINLSRSQDTDEFKRLLQKTRYAPIFKADEEHLWEVNSMDYLFGIFKNHLRRGGYNFGGAVAYLHLKEMDIKNIITLIEGVRYSLPREEIRSYLIGIRE